MNENTNEWTARVADKCEPRSVPSARPKPPRLNSQTLRHIAPDSHTSQPGGGAGSPSARLDWSRNFCGWEVPSRQAEGAQAWRSQSRPALCRRLRDPEPRDASLTCRSRQARYGSGRSSQRLLPEPEAVHQTQCPPGTAHPGEGPPPHAYWPLAQNEPGSIGGAFPAPRPP